MCGRAVKGLIELEAVTFSVRLTSQIHRKRFFAISLLINFGWFCPEGIWKFHDGFPQRLTPCVSGGLHSPQSLEMLRSASTTEGQNKLDRLKLPGDVHHTILSSTLVLWRQIMESSPVRLFTDCFQRESAVFRSVTREYRSTVSPLTSRRCAWIKRMRWQNNLGIINIDELWMQEFWIL